eukprot:scaffold347_cov239-Pinguiococcus_pyrenoidosus.AAC.24
MPNPSPRPSANSSSLAYSASYSEPSLPPMKMRPELVPHSFIIVTLSLLTEKLVGRSVIVPFKPKGCPRTPVPSGSSNATASSTISTAVATASRYLTFSRKTPGRGGTSATDTMIWSRPSNSKKSASVWYRARS